MGVLRELALFAGAGGGILGGHLLGWRTVCAVEIDAFCREVLLRRQLDGCLPRFPIWDDVTTFDGRPWRGCVDVVSGGFPCQPFSSAAHGNNTAEDLWPEMRRIIEEIHPPFVFAENVSRQAIDAAADDVIAVGYAAKCLRLGTADMGGASLRYRYWMVARADRHGKPIMSVNEKAPWVPDIPSAIPWPDPPVDMGVVDGVAHRVDRIRALGNGQVPIVAAAAWEALR